MFGDNWKIENGFTSDASGKNSSEIRIGLRDSKNAVKKLVEVDKKILAAGQHHGSTYYQHMEFIKSINNNLKAQVSVNDGLHAVAIGQAAEKSIKENRMVKMSEFNI